MADGVAGCEALVCALLSVEPDIPNANDLILRAAVAATYLAEEASLRCARGGGRSTRRQIAAAHKMPEW